MRHERLTNSLLLLTLAAIAPLISIHVIPAAHAENAFTLTPLPAFTQEGNTISLVLTVSNANSGTTYQFMFFVTDPANQTSHSALQTYTTRQGENQFNIPVSYPSPTFLGSNSLVGQYNARADLLGSVIPTTVATTHFYYGLTDNIAYERTQTVNIHATGYDPSESVSVSIVTTKPPATTAFSQTVIPSSVGIVSTSWRIPVNATVDTYLLSLSGTITVKTPADAQPFSVKQALMTISAITSLQSSYQRTETMQFSFQPMYPDRSPASTGVALLTLAKPDGRNITLAATYDNASQNFETSYQTSTTNETGTWTARLAAFAYSDAYGNSGPTSPVTSTTQLAPATLTVNVATGTSFTVGQQMSFNASITYPDGTVLQSGMVGAYLLLSGGTLNESVPMLFDTNLRVWVGTFTWRSSDAGGLWSLNVKVSDASSSPNSGSATRAVILDNAAAGSSSFPLYFFGIAAGLIAAGLLGGLFFFRRRKHGSIGASLKIDLEAVKSEAGRIENQDFFQSIKDQVKKDIDE